MVFCEYSTMSDAIHAKQVSLGVLCLYDIAQSLYVVEYIFPMHIIMILYDTFFERILPHCKV